MLNPARKMRQPLRNIHLWTGLTLGLALSLFSLFGSILFFRSEIDRAAQPKWISKSVERPNSPLDAAALNVATRWPGSRLSRVTIASSADGTPLEMALRTATGDNLRVFANTRSGEVLGTFRLPWLELLTNLHHNLLLGPTGRGLAGIFGITLFVMSLSGLCLWLFRKPRISGIWQIQRGGSRSRLYFDLHKTAGLLSYSILLIVSLTGIAMVR